MERMLFQASFFQGRFVTVVLGMVYTFVFFVFSDFRFVRILQPWDENHH